MGWCPSAVFSLGGRRVATLNGEAISTRLVRIFPQSLFYSRVVAFHIGAQSREYMTTEAPSSPKASPRVGRIERLPK